MKVLILCDLFPPAFGPRMGYLCKYLVKLGWKPTVLTEEMPDSGFAFLADVCPVRRVKFYPSKTRWIAKLQWLTAFLTDGKERRMYREAMRMTRDEAFDVILCSTYRTFPLRAAARLARERNLPWVADLRDVVEQYSGYEFVSSSWPKRLGRVGDWMLERFKRHCIAVRDEALASAACITTVSPWHVSLLEQKFKRVRLIYNGFDPELFYPRNEKSIFCTITYTGRLLSSAMRDPSLLFEAVRRLLDRGLLLPHTFQIMWYTDRDSWDEALTLARKYEVGNYLNWKFPVKADLVPYVLNDSSIILILTNRAGEKGPQGVMTTKFFEALAVQKPILCVRSDEGVLAQALEETHAGLAARNVDEVCDFIMKYYRMWQQQGFTRSDADPKQFERYSRREQAKEFIQVFEEAIGK